MEIMTIGNLITLSPAGFETVGTQYFPLSKSHKISDNSWAVVPLPQDVKCNCITVKQITNTNMVIRFLRQHYFPFTD